MAGLTLASKGSGWPSKLQTEHGLHRLRSYCLQGCRMSENKKWNGPNKALQPVQIIHTVFSWYINIYVITSSIMFILTRCFISM